VLLALAWMAVNGSFSFTDLVVGLVLGLLVMSIASPFRAERGYAGRIWQGLGFLLWFLKELWVSSIKVARDILTPSLRARPGVIAVPLDAETDLEITMLACLVTLTPGTLSLDVSADRRTLYIHAMFVDDPDAIRAEIKDGMEKRLLEVMR
jgi:multicomponent Na+:H+ antiporter subunit E